MLERDIQDSIRLALGADRRVVLWRNNVGVAQINGRTQRFGLGVGSADLVGFLTNEAGSRAGLHVELEVKTPQGRQSEEQRQREALINSRGGFYAVVRSVEDAVAAINRACAS